MVDWTEQPSRRRPGGDFSPLIASIAAGAIEAFRAAMQPLTTPEAALQLEQLALAQIENRLTTLLGRTLVLELHIARLRGRLRGDDPQARFRDFIDSLVTGGVGALFCEYPVLARQVAARLDDALSALGELLRHLEADRQALAEQFAPSRDLGFLTALETVGDTHRRGRAVAIVSFSSGVRLVYKPRSLAVDRHFQELLVWVNARTGHPPFRTLGLVDRESHGWTEFVPRQDCREPSEAQRFYVRQGGYLALLYVLGASDCHYENWIAAGEHPYLIDLECLFQGSRTGEGLTPAERAARQRLEDSVLRTGMLPERLWSGRDPEGVGVEISGLGAGPDQLSPSPLPVWEDPGTDCMRLVYRRVCLPRGHNRPSLAGVLLHPGDYVEALTAGFRGIYALLLSHREVLAAPDGPLAAFGADRLRCILRPTQVYARLLGESYGPDLLRDEHARAAFFARAARRVAPGSGLAAAVAHEQEDLRRGDIPYFTARADARYLESASGTRLDDWFSQSGLEGVHRRLAALGPEDLARQLLLVRSSLAVAPPPNPVVGAFQPAGFSAAEPERLIATAIRVGKRLRALAIEAGSDITWLAAGQCSVFSRVPFGLLGLDLYGGLPGIALFFAHLGALTGDGEYEVLARRTARSVQEQIRRDGDDLLLLGGYCGWGGTVYALAQLGTLWDDRNLLYKSLELARGLGYLVARDRHLDVMTGAAGCILGLADLHERLPTGRLLPVLLACGEHLLLESRPTAGGIGWSPGGKRLQPGYAHGAAGIAAALLRLAALSNEARFRDAAWSALAAEPPQASSGYGRSAWCRGAAGIGLARLQMLRQGGEEPRLRDEVEAAVQATFASGFGRGPGLCHGALGCLDFLLQAAGVLTVPRWRRDVYRLAAGLLPDIEDRSALPGLMDGLAGLGYGLLRLAAPERVPSVLTLHGPGRH